MDSEFSSEEDNTDPSSQAGSSSMGHMESSMELCSSSNRRRCSFSSSSFTYIPQSALDKIMRKVDCLQTLLKWRLVNKEWNEVIMSKHWTSATNLRSQTSIPLLINCRQHSLTKTALLTLSDNSRSNKWKKINIDINEAPNDSDLYRRCRHNSRNRCLEFLRSTTAGSLGLIFFTRYCASHFDSDFSLLVYNPVTRMRKPLEIPDCFPKGHLRLVGVLTDGNEMEEQLSYKLLFATVTESNELSFGKFLVYESRNRTWKLKASNPDVDEHDQISPFFQITSSVSCDGCFYFLHTRSGWTENVHRGHNGCAYLSSLFRPRLAVYDSEVDKWHELPLTVAQDTYAGAPYFPQLVQNKGTVFYVALCQTELQNSNEITWCFFRLNHVSDRKSNSSWTRVREMPVSLFQVFDMYTRSFHDLETGRHDVRCEGQGDFMYFYCVRPSNILRNSVANPISSSGHGVPSRPGPVEGVVLLHDFERNVWRFLRKYPQFGNNDLSGVKLESFRPSFVDV
ncbi:hypothetical protein R1flu_024473 [Riccia fluitans]|uniref:F-box domain-containing protein n=1 Tax=Riccia fluitans TaxID=41844 RepID=A0ABD1XXY5_9MARC